MWNISSGGQSTVHHDAFLKDSKSTDAVNVLIDHLKLGMGWLSIKLTSMELWKLVGKSVQNHRPPNFPPLMNIFLSIFYIICKNQMFTK